MSNSRVKLHAYQFGSFQVWDEPLEGKRYVVGIDTAEGRERDLGHVRAKNRIQGRTQRDFHAGVVIELLSGQHVATWHGELSVIDWAFVAAAVGFYFNTALIVPEINSNGISVIETLARRIRYPRMYVNRLWGSTDGDDLTSRLGWRTSAMSRPLLINLIEEMLSSGGIFTRDHDLIAEMRTMEIDDKGVARARRPNHDDRVMALGMALQGRYELLQNVQESAPADAAGQIPPLDQQVWDRIRARRGSSDDPNRDPLGDPGFSGAPFDLEPEAFPWQ